MSCAGASVPGAALPRPRPRPGLWRRDWGRGRGGEAQQEPAHQDSQHRAGRAQTGGPQEEKRRVVPNYIRSTVEMMYWDCHCRQSGAKTGSRPLISSAAMTDETIETIVFRQFPGGLPHCQQQQEERAEDGPRLLRGLRERGGDAAAADLLHLHPDLGGAGGEHQERPRHQRALQPPQQAGQRVHRRVQVQILW